MNRIREFIKSKEPVKWIFYGDSITQGILHTYGQRDYVELFAEYIHNQLGRKMDIIINTAISENNTRDLLSSFDWRVAQFIPDVVFVMIGMNDCGNNIDIGIENFEENLLELTSMIDRLGAVAVLQTTCPIILGHAADRLPYFDSYMDIIRKVAANNKLPLIDHTHFWKQHSDKHILWMSDALHPNGYGHKVLANQIYSYLNIEST